MIYFFGGGHHTVFQSTHLREVRLIRLFRVLDTKEFQSTHLREVRRLIMAVLDSLDKFQSTHLREVRL